MNKNSFSGGLRKRGILKKDKKNLPLVSIITVVLNNKKFLQQSINSILNQTYKIYQVLNILMEEYLLLIPFFDLL